MRRRDFIAALGGAAAGSLRPLAARAQQRKVSVIGVLVLGNPDPEPFLKIFRDGLRNLGHVDGQTIRFEFRSARGQESLLSDLAAELVRLRVDVIVAWVTPAVMAAKQATTEIPIVMIAAGDPVATGLVASLARPGGNITGNASLSTELASKTIELIREALPSARRVTVLANAIDPFTKPFLAQIGLAAPIVGIDVHPIMLRPS